MRASVTKNYLHFSPGNFLVDKNLFFDQDLKAYWLLIAKCSQKADKNILNYNSVVIGNNMRRLQRNKRKKATIFPIT